MNGDEPAAPEDPLVSSLTSYHESRKQGSTEIRAGGAPAEGDPEFAELLLRAQACIRLLDRRWSGPNPTGDAGEIDSPLLSAASGVLSPGESAPARIGRFQIRRELGRGAFGIVFLAFDPDLGREVALKIARPETTVTPQFRRRFLMEAQAAAALNHPHLVSVFESGEWGPIYYIAQEYCAGPTLAAWLGERAEPVPVATAARLVATLAAALDSAHQHGIIHRDLKPSNVMLVPKSVGDGVPPRGHDDGLDFIPKIADFGLAKLLEKSVAETRSGQVLGTPGYMAPEQVEGRLGAIGPQTDIHALGVILYELLTGRPPFSGATDVEKLKRVALDEPARPHSLRASIPRDLEAICLKCLEKQPSRRYPTAAALADDLARFLAARPTLARPLGSLGRTVNWARRRPAAAALLAIGVLAVPAGFVGAWWNHTSFRNALAAEHMRHGFQDESRLIRQQKAVARDRELHPGRYAYVADVNAAFVAWKKAHITKTVNLLSRHTPKTGDEDLRSFAWYYLWRLSHDASRSLGERAISQLASPPEVLAFSPDGRQIGGLTPYQKGNQQSFQVWDTATGAEDSRPKLVGSVGGAAMSDGRRMVARATGQRGTITIKTVDSKEDRWQSSAYTLQPLVSERPVALLCMALAPDGQTLATGHAHEKISLWSLGNGRKTATMIPEEGSDVAVLQFSPDGKTVASGATNGALRLWNVATGKEQAAVPGDGQSINGITFSPDGTRLAAASRGRTVKLWNTNAEAEPATLQGHADEVRSVAFSPDGKTVASGSADGTIRLWDVATWQELISLEAQPHGVNVVAFSPDGSILASSGTAADGRGEVRLWSTTSGDRSRAERKKTATAREH